MKVSSTLEMERIPDTSVKETRQEYYQKLLAYIDSDQYYSVSRLFSLVSSTGGYPLHRIAGTILIVFRRLV